MPSKSTLIVRALGHIRLLHPESTGVIFRDAFHLPYKESASRKHLHAAMQWLARAQDATHTGGVSVGYSLRYGWLPPYPETTGYIIPTFFDYATLTGNMEYTKRAIRMLEWEKSIQLTNGAIMSGYHLRQTDSDADIPPAVFNTGQVILGWCRGYKETGNAAYLVCAKKAGEWLLAMQDDDGAWRRGLSPLPNSPPVHTYNTRVAWALIELALLAHNTAFERAARKNLDWALCEQQANGWFQNTAFHNGENPLTHSICYTIEGFLNAGTILNHPIYTSAATLSAEALMQCFKRDDTLYARYDSAWHSADRSICLTGAAQAAVIWFQVFTLTKDKRFLHSAKKMVDFIKGTQNLATLHHGIQGGIKGSHPIYGSYVPFTYINWATKFFADALMLEQKLAQEIAHSPSPSL